MHEVAITDGYLSARCRIFKWRCNLSLTNKVALAFGMACLTGLAAQVRMPLPWTPVPITGQTFAVLLAGVLLGRAWGGISQALYVAIGAAGVPWFAGASSGYVALLGPSGGYITGFVFAALFLGYVTDRYVRARSFLPMLGLMLFANFVLIHGPGLLQLQAWSALNKGSGLGLWPLLSLGTVPFIPGDLLKIVVAATMAGILTPKEASNDEVDVEQATRR